MRERILAYRNFAKMAFDVLKLPRPTTLNNKRIIIAGMWRATRSLIHEL